MELIYFCSEAVLFGIIFSYSVKNSETSNEFKFSLKSGEKNHFTWNVCHWEILSMFPN